MRFQSHLNLLADCEFEYENTIVVDDDDSALGRAPQ
jgi:hypothetical protein